MWALFAFGSAILASVNSIIQKETLQKIHAVQLMTLTAFSMVFYSLFLVGFVNFNISFQSFALILLVSVISVFSSIFAIKAMRHMDVSVVAPFFNLGTAFVAVLAYLFLGERLTIMDIFGVLLLILGGYALELKHRNLLQPIKDLINSKYIHYLLGGVLLFSTTFLFDKIVLNTVDPVSYMFLRNVIMMIIFTVITFSVYGGARDIQRGVKLTGWFIPIIGITAIIETLLFYEALKGAPVSLVTPLYRTWTLWAVIFGGRLLHENHLAKRAIASIMMIAGAALILI